MMAAIHRNNFGSCVLGLHLIIVGCVIKQVCCYLQFVSREFCRRLCVFGKLHDGCYSILYLTSLTIGVLS